MKQALVSFVFIFGFAAVGFGAVNDNGTVSPDHTQPTEDRAKLYLVYKDCADAALQRQLGKDEVLRCTAIYIALKLSFVEGVTLADYASLDAATRARVNRQGYLAYREWVEERIIGLK